MSPVVGSRLRPAPLLRAPRHLDATGELLDVLLSRADTGGVFSVMHVTSPAGTTVPTHIHTRGTEAFYVLEGSYEFTVSGHRTLATPGTLVFIPRGAPHGYRVPSGSTWGPPSAPPEGPPSRALLLASPSSEALVPPSASNEDIGTD